MKDLIDPVLKFIPEFPYDLGNVLSAPEPFIVEQVGPPKQQILVK